MTVQEIPSVLTATRSRISILIGVLLMLFLLAFVGLNQPSAQVATSVPKSFVVTEERNVRAAVSIGGTVVPVKSVTLSAQVPGRVLDLFGSEGKRFREGDELVTLDDDDLRAQQESASAQLANAEVVLRNAGVQFQRELVSPTSTASTPGGMGMPSMFDSMFTKPMSGMMGTRKPGLERGAELHAASAQVSQAQGAVVQAQSRIREIEAKLRDTVSKAPFGGVIIAKHVEVGDTVQPGQPLLEIADTAGLQVQADIPQRLASGLKEGMELPARVDIAEEPIEVTVAQIFPVADPKRHTIRVKFSLPPSVDAAAGMYAEVMVPDRRSSPSKTLVVPSSAVVKRGGLPMVYVLNDTDDAELRMVRLGDPVDHVTVAVLSGLYAGDRVVPNPGARRP